MKTSAPCDICGATRYERVIRGIRGNPAGEVFRCLGCDLVFLNNKATPDEVEARYRSAYRYEPNYNASPGLLYLAPPRDVLTRRQQAIGPFLTKKVRLLEIGCGSGEFLRAVTPQVAEVAGIELNSDQAKAGRKAGLAIHPEPIERLVFEQRFDMVCAFQTFEHMPAPRAALEAIGRALAPNGTLFLEVPNVEDALLARYQVPEFAPFYFRDSHLYYYSPRTLERLLTGCGFRSEVEVVQQYSLTNHLHWLYRGGPQASLADGMSVVFPFEPRPDGVPPEVAGDLKAFWTQADDQYRKLLAKAGHADTIWCRAQRG